MNYAAPICYPFHVAPPLTRFADLLRKQEFRSYEQGKRKAIQWSASMKPTNQIGLSLQTQLWYSGTTAELKHSPFVASAGLCGRKLVNGHHYHQPSHDHDCLTKRIMSKARPNAHTMQVERYQNLEIL